MRVHLFLAIGAAWALPLAVLADEVPASQDAPLERLRIDRERGQANVELNAKEQRCYSNFAVNACLHEVGMRRIQIMSDLRRQETKLNDAQRMHQGQEQRDRMQEKTVNRAVQDAQALEATGTGFTEKQAAQRDKQAAHAQKLKDAEQRRLDRDVRIRDTKAEKALPL
jgi:hypothetical protein